VVHISSIVHVSMDKLSAGMAVKVSADSGDPSSKVYFFSHKMHTSWHEFIRISSDSGHAVTLSSIHYIYANGKLTAASSVRIGDELRTLDGIATVSSVETVRERGLFAPHTLHGDLVVNRVVVSTYTQAVHPTIAHALLGPVRALVRLGVSDEPLGNVMYEGLGWIKRFSSLLGGGTLLSMWRDCSISCHVRAGPV
jgi:Hint module